MPLPLNQRFSGGTNITTITRANSGANGNNAFDVSAVTNGQNQYSSTQFIHSPLAGQVSTAASIGVVAYWAWTTSIGDPVSQLWGRAYIFLTASPAVTDSVIQFRGTQGTAAGGIQLTTARQLALLTATGSVAATFTSVIPLNQWVRVEFNIGSGSAGSFLDVRYYASPDSTTISEEKIDTAGTYGGTGGFAEVDFGWTNNHPAQPTTYWDSLQLNGTGWPGPDPGLTPAPAPAGMPVFQLLAGFGAQAGQDPAYTDISPYMRNFQLQRTATRLQGPLYQFQGGTLAALLKAASGIFDPDNLHGPFVTTTGLQVKTAKFFTTGSFSWTAPANLVGTADVVCIAGGGGGGGMSSVSYIFNGGGGGGAECAEEPNLAVTAGITYSGTIGAGGTAGTPGNNGGAGGNTTFTGDAVTVTAHGGSGGGHGTTASGGAQGAGGAGGTGSANTNAHAGGAGGAGGGAAGFNGGGGGGGGSGGPGLPGNVGGGGSAQYPGYGAKSVPGGGAGGGRDHENGYAPGGGGGGGWILSRGPGVIGGSGFSGAGGWVIITYVVTVPAAAMTEVTGNVPVQLNAYWPDPTTGIFAHLFTGFTDGWQDSGVNVPGYAEVTMTATDLTKLLALAFLPTIGGAGAGEDSGARITRILNSAGFSSISVGAGDTALQALTQGAYALDLCQVTADTEAGEFYIDTDGLPFFRHRQGLLADFRSMFPQAVFSDLPNGAGPSGSAASWDFEDGTTQGWSGSNCTVANSTTWAYGPGAARSLLVTATAGAATAGFWQAIGPAAPGVAVVPGDFHGGEATVWTSGTNQVNQIGIAISWYTSGGVFISTTPLAPGVPIPPGQAVHLPLHGLRVPAGAAQAYVVIIDNEGSPAGTQFWIDYVLFDPALKYTQPGRANDTTTLANDIQYTRPGGTLQEAKSLTSIAANQGATVSYQRSDVMYNTDADALRGAQWVLSVSIQSEDRVETLAIEPRSDAYGINPHVLTRRIGDKIRFIRHPPNVVTPMVRDLYIKGITIGYDAPASVYTLTWQTQDTTKYGAYIILDDVYAGRTDFAGVAY